MEEDLELDSENLQGDMKHSQPVRKAISIKLKASKMKKRSSKSGKIKKEKGLTETKERDRDLLSDDRDKSPRRSKSSSHHHGSRFARQGKEELAWDQTISLCGQKVPNPVFHTCSKCNFPILVYGRLSPCKHVFCLTCAEAASSKCPRCDDRVDRIEPAGIDQIFVCSFGGSRHGTSGCRKSYLSQRDLTAHINHRHQKDHTSSTGVAEALKHSELQVQQINTFPYFGNQYFETQQFMRPNMPAMHPNPSPMDNRLLLGGLQPRDPTFMDAQRMAPPGNFPTIQTGQFPSQPGFHSDQGVPRPSMPGTVGPGMENLYLPHSTSGQFSLPPNVSRPGASLAPNSVHYHEANQQFLQAGMTLSQAPTAMQPPRMETGMQRGHVDAVQMPRGIDNSAWHVAGPPPQHARPPDNWSQQGNNSMVTGYDATRYPPPYFK